MHFLSEPTLERPWCFASTIDIGNHFGYSCTRKIWVTLWTRLSSRKLSHIAGENPELSYPHAPAGLWTGHTILL